MGSIMGLMSVGLAVRVVQSVRIGTEPISERTGTWLPLSYPSLGFQRNAI